MTFAEGLSAWADAATIFTGLAIFLAIFPFHETRKQRARDADQWYVDRYWALQDRKRVRARRGRIITEAPLDVLVAELKLCEDELDARANGWVTNTSWSIWSESIGALQHNRRARDVLERMPANEMQRLRVFLRDLEDPQRIAPIQQWWRGMR